MTSRGEKTLWEIAIEERDNQEKANKQGPMDPSSSAVERNLLVCGASESGKTSMILRFLERDEKPKPTVALDYTFARRPKGHNMLKDVCHVWELGGGTSVAKLIEIAISPKNISEFAVMLVLDLSQPNILWQTQDVLIKEIHNSVNRAIKEASKENPQVAKILKEKSWERVGANHPDKSMLEPLQIPFVIIGSKFDVYQEFEPDKKKMLCKTLRFLAHRNGATLQFSSNKIDNLSSKTRVIMANLAFCTNIGKTSVTDHNKPIIIHAGQDKFDDIGAPQISSDRLVRMKSGTPYDLWREAFAELFPPEKIEDLKSIPDPSADEKYAEPLVDSMRTQKDEELARYRKEIQRKEKESNVTSKFDSNKNAKNKQKV